MVSYTLTQLAQIVGGNVIGDGETVFEGVITDSRVASGKQLFVPIVGERVNGHSFVNSLIENNQIAGSLWEQDQKDLPENFRGVIVNNSVEALQKLAAYYRNSFKDITVVGVTGSSGKTSTKDIISAVLSAEFRVHKTQGNHNNEIGVPMTLLSVDKDNTDIAIIEMGISDFGEMDQLVDMVDPDYTVISSIGPAHIMNFKTMDNIVEQKCRINRDLGEGRCYYNADAYGLKKYLESRLDIKAIGYGFGKGAEVRVDDYQLDKDGTYFKLNISDYEFFVPVLGKHQILNSTAAILLGLHLGMSINQIQRGLDKVVLTPHRLQLSQIRDSIIIDDAYNANPLSLLAALELLKEYDDSLYKIAVLGDMLELGEDSAKLHSDIAEQFDFSSLDEVYLYGSEMKNLYDSLQNVNVISHYFDDYEKLYEALSGILEGKKAILFKASNGMKFIDLISRLGELQ